MSDGAKSKMRDKQAMRKIYTWHLHDSGFDRTHWWCKLPNSKIKPVAALYELVRRHPLIGAGRMGLLDWRNRPLLDPLWFLSTYGLKSWPKLDWRVRACWPKVAGHMKGVDCRDADIQCTSIEAEVFTQVQFKRAFTQKKYRRMKMEKVSALVEKDVIKHPPSTKEMEAAIKKTALEAYRAGYLLISIAPDLEAHKAKALMAEEYRRHRILKRIPKQRSRNQNWLCVIAEFEKDETSEQKAKSQIFARYRRVLDSIHLS